MDLATQAELAEKRGDFADAVRYYQALAKAVPHRSISYGKMCAAYEALGDRDNGLTACRSALGREGVRLEDHARTVRLLLGGKGPLQPRTRTTSWPSPATCEGIGDDERRRRDALPARHPDRGHQAARDLRGRAHRGGARQNLKTLSYRWALALEQRDFAAASHLVPQARAAGLDAVGVEKMQRAVSDRQWRHRLPLLAGVALLVAGLIALALSRGWWSGLASRLLRRQPA